MRISRKGDLPVESIMAVCRAGESGLVIRLVRVSSYGRVRRLGMEVVRRLTEVESAESSVRSGETPRKFGSAGGICNRDRPLS